MAEPIRYFTTDFTVLPNDSYNGMIELFHANGKLKYRGAFNKGRREGAHIEYWENGNVMEISYWKNDWVVGTTLKFEEEGVRVSEEDFGENGSLKGQWTERSYDPVHGGLIAITEWNEENSREVWVDPEYASWRIDPQESQKSIDSAVQEWLRSTGRSINE